MSTALKQSPMPLRDVLYEFALAQDTPDAELLDEFARRYPQYAPEITNFAIEVFCKPLENDTEECPISVAKVSPAVSRAMSKYQSTLHSMATKVVKANVEGAVKEVAIESPFTSLDQKSFRSLAKSVNANSIFLCKVRDRQIIPSTIRPGFLRLLGERLSSSFEVLTMYVNAKPAIAGAQLYKADVKPSVGTQQSYEAAVESSNLTPDQKKFLLSI